jgi:hypothetical protein
MEIMPVPIPVCKLKLYRVLSWPLVLLVKIQRETESFSEFTSPTLGACGNRARHQDSENEKEGREEHLDRARRTNRIRKTSQMGPGR